MQQNYFIIVFSFSNQYIKHACQDEELFIAVKHWVHNLLGRNQDFKYTTIHACPFLFIVETKDNTTVCSLTKTLDCMWPSWGKYQYKLP